MRARSIKPDGHKGPLEGSLQERVKARRGQAEGGAQARRESVEQAGCEVFVCNGATEQARIDHLLIERTKR